MHEYSLVQSMFDQIGAIVAANGAVSVKRVRVTLGDRAGVEPALFETAYGVYRIRTCCADAPLEIAHVAGGDLTLDSLELEVP